MDYGGFDIVNGQKLSSLELRYYCNIYVIIQNKGGYGY